MSLTKHFYFIILLNTLHLCGLCSVYMLSALECVAQDKDYAVASFRVYYNNNNNNMISFIPESTLFFQSCCR